MNKRKFTNELKELMGSMSEEEIEKTIDALSDCKSDIFRKTNQEKSDKSRLLSTANQTCSELYYQGINKNEGILKVLGATLLSSYEYNKFRSSLPRINDEWWLSDHDYISDNNPAYEIFDSQFQAKIRPVLVIDKIEGNLKNGQSFFINNEMFRLINRSLAIKETCLEDLCTYATDDYEKSVIKFCVDGWYMKLIKDNKVPRQNSDET